MQFMQSNSLPNIAYTMLSNTPEERDGHAGRAEVGGLQAMYSSTAVKSGGPCTFGPPLPESEGSEPHRP